MPDVHPTHVGEVRIVALSRISPGPDFNPRTARDPERQRARAGPGRGRAVDGRYSVDGHRLRKQLEAPAQTDSDAADASEEPAAQAA